MYALFLETKACKQIDRFVAAIGGDADAIKLKCYINAQAYMLRHQKDKSQQAWDNWWVELCLKDDSHVVYSVDDLMLWFDTPEGQAFWEGVNNFA